MSLEGTYGHSLTVNRVERARGVAEYDEPLGPWLDPVVPPKLIFSSPIAVSWRKWLGISDDVVDHRTTEGSSKLQESQFVGRRVVASNANQRHEPAIVVHWKQHTATRK